jgi:hypothetical protein
MAAGLGYKEFATGDVLTAALANGYLASQVVMVFADAAARTSAITSPQEGMFSYLKDTNATEYYSGSAWTAIGGGGGGGKVLQVVSATTTTATSSSSTTLADTTLTATITPTSATSKVLVLVNQNGILRTDGNANSALTLKLLRGATVISQIADTSVYTGTALVLTVPSASMNYLDSPATTSATTYKTQFANRVAAAEIVVQHQSNMSSIVLLEIGA